MNKVFVIGAGGVSSVTIHKMAQLNNEFNEIVLASRNIEKCKNIQKKIKDRYGVKIKVEELDADNIKNTCKFFWS